MKKLIYIVFLLSGLSKITIAQNKIVIMNSDPHLVKKSQNAKMQVLISDPFLDNFVGTWEGKQGNKSLILIMTKKTINVGSIDKPLEIEMLNGGYKLTVNGKETLNTLSTKPMYGNSENNSNPVILKVTNFKLNYQNAINMILITENSIKLELGKLKGEGVKIDPSFYIPTNIILKKKN